MRRRRVYTSAKPAAFVRMPPRSPKSAEPEESLAAAPADPVARFEAALKELEEIVARMEDGELPLEQALQLFERGVALARDCRAALDSAELRVKTLLENDSAASADSEN
jgi:exodeoxyribonuclease VII small subunit